MHIEEQFVDWLKAAYFMEVDTRKRSKNTSDQPKTIQDSIA